MAVGSLDSSYPIPSFSDMYPSTAVDLPRLEINMNMTMPINQHLLDRYASEEEALSEPEPDQGDHAFSPVISQRAAEADADADSDSDADSRSDSNLSAEDSGCESSSSNENVNSKLLSLSPRPSAKAASRPVSIDTIKRTSAHFDPECETRILDGDDPDDVIIEIPPTDDEPPIQSPVFLQPTVYVPDSPQVQRQTSSASKRVSLPLPAPGSPMFGYEEESGEGDVRVAEQVTYKPVTRPNLILISSFGRAGRTGLGMSGGSERERHALKTDVNVPPVEEPDGDGGVSPKTVPAPAPAYGASATITSLSEVPSIPYTFSPRGTKSRPTSIGRPKTSTLAEPTPEKATRGRMDSASTTNGIRRPPSARSLVSLARSTPNSPQPQPCPSIPAPYYSPPTFNRTRSGSTSTTMTTGHILRSQLKHAASPSMLSMSSRSIRSEVDADAESVYTVDSSATLVEENGNRSPGFKSLRKRASRGRALGRIRQKSSPSISAGASERERERGRLPTAGSGSGAGSTTAAATATAKGFVGFMLGRKKTVTTGSGTGSR